MTGIILIDRSCALINVCTGYTTVGALQSCVTSAGEASNNISTLGLGMTIVDRMLVLFHTFIDIQT